MKWNKKVLTDFGSNFFTYRAPIKHRNPFCIKGSDADQKLVPVSVGVRLRMLGEGARLRRMQVDYGADWRGSWRDRAEIWL